ncbi:hypothetical protein M5J07_19060 [Achromobacter mucicolens]|uniref:hypothetical protein n=1 Tax=Achromobacter mucicolens TaxID=1389922 RepID=UPI0020A31C8E|nr:hypothetical protein [Achromobacter mucicolens]MCP2517046.1 hypothetical protein [Achromobacter mucicolens]
MSLLELLGCAHRLVEFPCHGAGGVGGPLHLLRERGNPLLCGGQLGAGGLQASRQLAELANLALRGGELLELAAQVGNALRGRAGRVPDFL